MLVFSFAGSLLGKSTEKKFSPDRLMVPPNFYSTDTGVAFPRG
jgi:hypothetical protein